MSFFDRIGNGVAEAGNNMAQKAKELTEQNRLNVEVNKKETRKKECYMALGEMYHRSVKEGTAPEFSEIIEEIDRLTLEIEELKQELRKVKGVASCPHCHMEIARNSAFCPNCGGELKRENVCRNCGNVLEDGAKFCVICGTKVNE